MNIKTAYFEITNQCNLNCMTCYNRSGANKERLEISPEQLRSSIERLSVYELERILIAGGEPTLHSDFDEILNLVDKYSHLSFGIVTNGTIHNPKLIDMLNTRDNFTLQVSLDGSNEEENAKTRGSGNYNKTIEFAWQIHRMKTKPLMKMVISQNNIDDVESFYRRAVSLNFVPEFAFVDCRGNARDGWNEMGVSSQQKLSVIKQLDVLNKELDVDAFLPLCTTGCPYAEGMKDLSLCIKADGTIQPCSILYDSEYSLGNIFDFTYRYFTQRLEYISELASKRKTIDYGCDRCIMRNNNCGKGCMAVALLANGDILADDGDCDFRKKELLWKIRK